MLNLEGYKPFHVWIVSARDSDARDKRTWARAALTRLRAPLGTQRFRTDALLLI